MPSLTNIGSVASPLVEYRVYVLDKVRRIFRPADLVAAADDEAAIGVAVKIAAGRTVELWDGSRLVRCRRNSRQPKGE